MRLMKLDYGRDETTMKKLFTLLLVCLLALALFGCANEPATNQDNDQTEQQNTEQTTLGEWENYQPTTGATEYPLTLNTYFWLGREVTQTYEQAPERVITCGGTIADLMVYFGLEDRIIGISRTDDPSELPEEYQETRNSLPVLAELWPSKEVVVDAEADLIASAYGGLFYDDDLGTIEEINGRGTTIFNLTNMSCFEAGRSVTIDDYFTSLENFGKIFDIQDAMGEFLVQQRDSLLEIKEKAAAATDTPSVMVLTQWEYHIENDLYCNYSGEAIINDLIRLAGGDPVMIADTESNQVSKEAIVAADPDIIILRIEGDPEDAVENFKPLPEFQSMSAVQNDKVIMISMDYRLDNYGYDIASGANVVYEALDSVRD